MPLHAARKMQDSLSGVLAFELRKNLHRNVETVMYTDPSHSRPLRILLIQSDVVGGVQLRLAIESAGLRIRMRVIEGGLEAVRSVCESIRKGEISPDLILAEIDPSEAWCRELVRSIRTCSETARVRLVFFGDGQGCDADGIAEAVTFDRFSLN